MTSLKQRAANRVNALKSTGPQTDVGKKRVSLNATTHGLSRPIDERLLASEIKAISRLVRQDCNSDAQAFDIAKRIIDYERNESFLIELNSKDAQQEVNAWAVDPHRLALVQLAQDHSQDKPVNTVFTTTDKNPQGRERKNEIAFIDDFLKLQDHVHARQLRAFKNEKDTALRYQKRAINQLVKGIKSLTTDNQA